MARDPVRRHRKLELAGLIDQPPRGSTPGSPHGAGGAQTYYQQQAFNRRLSLVLIVGVAASLFLVLFTLLYVAGLEDFGQIALPAAAGFALGAYELGEPIVLWASRARPATHIEQRVLLNVVRELSIAGNIPMPAVYVIDDEAANILATARDGKRTSLAVTTGLLETLDREELQGVVAHEVAHLRSFDTRLGMAIVVFLRGLPFVWDAVRTPRAPGRGRVPDATIRVGLLLVAGLGVLVAMFAPLFAVAIQLAVGNQREYLADATAVELTRNPSGLERALAKLENDVRLLRGANRATRPLYFVDPFRVATSRRYAQPTIKNRIQRLRDLQVGVPVAHPGDPASA